MLGFGPTSSTVTALILNSLDSEVVVTTLIDWNVPALVDKRVRFNSHDSGNEVLGVVSSWSYLNEPIECATNEHQTSCPHEPQEPSTHIHTSCGRLLMIIKRLYSEESGGRTTHTVSQINKVPYSGGGIFVTFVTESPQKKVIFTTFVTESPQKKV